MFEQKEEMHLTSILLHSDIKHNPALNFQIDFQTVEEFYNMLYKVFPNDSLKK